MSWVRIDPQRIRKSKIGLSESRITKSDESKRVLAALDAYIDDNENEPVRWLVSLWNEQEKAFTYSQLRQIVLGETAAKEIFDKWFQDYSKFVEEKMTDQWKKGFLAGAYSNPKIQELQAQGFQVYTTSVRVREWIQNRTGELITRCTNDQVSAIRYIIAECRSKGMSSIETARYIRPTVGLNGPQAKANLRVYETAKKQLRDNHPRMSAESVEKKAREIAAKDAERKHRYRAQMIARTENAFAYNEGYDESVRQAQEAGLMPKMIKKWSTSVANACTECEELDGNEIEMDEEFVVMQSWRVKDGAKHYGTKEIRTKIPPLHPNCRCCIMYEEAE